MLIAFLTGCISGGSAIPTSHLEAPDRLVATGSLDAPLAVVVPVHNDGRGSAAVRVSVDLGTASPTRFELRAGGTVPVAITLLPTEVGSFTATLTLDDGISAIQVPVGFDVLGDFDGDGFDSNSAGGDDCDDRDPTRNPGADETCDRLDSNCDGDPEAGAIDAEPWFVDADGDTYGAGSAVVACDAPDGAVSRGGDCDDADGDVSPAASEVWYDGVDQDCSGGSDDDADGDGFDGLPAGGDDCLDTDPHAHPGAAEVWYDGVDQDCSGGSDGDQDADGAIAEAVGGPDCDDLDASVRPGLGEDDDGVDQDCDGMIDEDFIVVGDLVIDEILRDPAVVADAHGQYVEVRALRDLNLAGFEVASRHGSGPLAAVELGAGDVAVLCVDVEFTTNGGVACDAALPAVLGSDDAISVSVDGRELDAVDFRGWVSPGAALELFVQPDPADNDLRTSWCSATVQYGAGDFGTPGSAVTSCP